MTTVAEVIESLLKPLEPLPATVDTLKCGRPDQALTGIATMFTASVEALRRAVEGGANFIITHEPTFYNHEDRTAWLENDAVYTSKRRLIEEAGLAIFRYHDYWHRVQPDGIMTGVVQALDWEAYVVERSPGKPWILEMPEQSATQIAEYIKRKLGLPFIRAAGDVAAPCRRIGLSPGYGPGPRTIPLYREDRVDLVIAGETPEWETPEYARDAVACGEGKAFLMLGHQKSEEAGMKYLAELLAAKYPDLPVFFVESEPALRHWL